MESIFEFTPFLMRHPEIPVASLNVFSTPYTILLKTLGTATNIVGFMKAASSLIFVISPQ